MPDLTGPFLQVLGGVLLVVGFGLWLGLAVAFIVAGIVLLAAGVVVELPSSTERDEEWPEGSPS